MKKIIIQTSDKVELTANLYKAENNIKGAVLLAGAMATPQAFYKYFAQWLSDQGFAVMTFDYRGTFDSKGIKGPKTHATFDIWGQLDVTAVANELNHQFEYLPKYYLGHSLGGQLFASCTVQHIFNRYIAVASGNGYWPKLSSFKARIGLFLVSQVWAPILTPFLGYFPGRKLGKIGDMPKGVAKQWTHWCKHPDYLARDEEQKKRFEAVNTPMCSILSNDDDVFTQKCIQFYRDIIGSKHKELLYIDAQAYNANYIGHHGYFRKSCDDIWPIMAAQLT